VNTSQNLNKAYGYLWWLNGKATFMVPTLQTVFPGYLCPNAPSDMISAVGFGGQFLNVVPSQNMVWLRMGDEPGNSLVPFVLNDQIWEYVNGLICSTSGIEEITVEQIQLYPNPVNEQITISNKDGSLDRIIIFNQLGSKMTDFFSDQATITCDISELVEGIYFVSLPESGITLRFVKNCKN
jgi:hypothetical protein